MKVDGRVNDAADITAWGGTITYQAATNAATAETLGNVRVERGSLTLNMDIPTSYGTTATVYIAGISQEQGILNFQHSNNGTYWLGRTPTNDCGPHFIVGGLTNGQTIPWATVNGAGFARYNTTNGIWAPLETEEFNAAADQTGQDLRFTFERDGAVDVLTANRSINTIVVSNQYDSFIDLAGNNLTLEGSGFRQIGANNFMITNSGGGGSLIAGDAVFFVNSATTRLAAATGLASLDKEGGGTLILLGAHTYTGRTAIGGTLQVGEDGAASIPTDAPVYNHGTLRFQTTTDHDFTANIQGLGSIVKYGNNTLTLSGTSNMVGSSFNIYSGSVTFASGSATYMTNNGGQLAIGSLNTGPISTMTIEPGALLDLGAYTPFYATHWAANSHTLINQDGGTFIVGTTNMQGFRLAHYSQDSTGIYNMANGLLVVSNRLTVAWDGRGFFNQSNGTVKVGQIALTPLDGGNRARTSQWNLVNGTLMLGQGGMTAYTNFPAQQFNVSGGTLMAWKTNTQVSQRIPVNLLGTMTVDGVAGDTVEMLGRASGAGGILKIGEGTAILAGTNTYGGGTTISNGTLVAKTFNALGSGDVTLSGGTLNLSLAGLNSADLPGNFNQRTNPVATVELGTSLAHFEQNVSGGTLSINTTAGYHGFLVVGGPTNVTYTFAESFDDNVMLRIISAGATNTVLNNGSWNTPTKGTITLAPGLHEFDLRLGNGAGGGGANAASWWTSWTMGFGYDPQGRDQEIGNNYLTMRDPGDGSLFLSDTQGFTVANAVNVTADSAISLIGAGGAKMTMSGAFGIGAQRLTVTNNMAGMLDLLGDMTLTGSPTFDIATNVTVTAAGAIGGGANGINKDGPGVLRLTGISTYAGTTRVMAGAVELADFGAIGSSATLQIDAGAKLVATNLAAGTLHLLAGQTLQGHGTFEGGLITDAGSTVRPGSSPGALTMVGDLTADAGSTFTFELNGTTAVTQYDQLLFGGGNVATLTLNGPTLQVLLGFTPSYGTVFEIVSGFGTLAGTPGEFDSRPDGSTFTVNTTEFQIDYNANDITLTVVPEPSSLGLVGLLGLLGWLNRRRMRSR
jgi:autotransporter-associated beta strand protein